MREAGDVCYADVYRDGTGVVEFVRKEDMSYAVRKLDNTKFRSHEVRKGLQPQADLIRIDYATVFWNWQVFSNEEGRSEGRNDLAVSKGWFYVGLNGNVMLLCIVILVVSVICALFNDWLCYRKMLTECWTYMWTKWFRSFADTNNFPTTNGHNDPQYRGFKSQVFTPK